MSSELRNHADRRGIRLPGVSLARITRRPASATAAAGMPIFSRHWLGLTLALPVILLLLIVIVFPEVWAVILSFTDYRPGSALNFVGTANYTRILTDPYFFNALSNTIKFILVAVLLQLVLGTGFALLLSRQFRFQKLWIALILAPSAMSSGDPRHDLEISAQCRFWPINYILYRLGIDAPYWFTNASYAFIALMIVYAWNTIPQTFIFVYPALISIPAEYHEAAQIDGASKWQSFRHITLPLIAPAILIAMVFRTIVAVRAFGEILVLTNGGPFRATEVLSIYLYKEGFVYFSWGTAAAVGWIILVVTMIVALPQICLLARRMYEA